MILTYAGRATASSAVALTMCLLVPPAATAQAATTTSSPPVGGPQMGSRGVVVAVPPTSRPLPKVSAKSFLVADLSSGDVVAAKNPHGRFRPASTIKVLTAVTLLPRLDKARVYKATFRDANVEGSKVGIVPGGTYTVHNLFEGMFLRSGNDASQALTGAAGGHRTTVRHMNATARGLGALDTTARNASGLDAPGQFTSAYDLALIARAAMQRADFRAYARKIKSRFPGKPSASGKPRRSFEIYTQNKLVLRYPGAIGIKTGWTTQARGTFIGAARRNGRTLLVTVLGSVRAPWRDAAALLDWGFASAAVAQPVGTLNLARTALPAEQPVVPARGAAAAAPAQGEELAAGPAIPPRVVDDQSIWRWPLRILATLIALVVLLRMRVLVKREIRKRRRRAAGLRPPARADAVSAVAATVTRAPVRPRVPTEPARPEPSSRAV